jgi:trk system potassium uptake protein TrkH
MYVTLFLSTGLLISRIESLPLTSCLFETGSALGTAGLTVGITTSLSLSSHIMLMFLMFAGRVGGLTLIYAAFSSSSELSKLPQEKITVG